ncbi:hypothetical protein D3C79_1083290 [compost metagenome]
MRWKFVISSWAFQRQNSAKENSFTDFFAEPVFLTTSRCTSALWPIGTKASWFTEMPLRSPVIEV